MKKTFLLIAAIIASVATFSQVEIGNIEILNNQDGVVLFSWVQESISDEYRMSIEQQGEVSRDNTLQFVDATVTSDEVTARDGVEGLHYSTDLVLTSGDNWLTKSKLSQSLWETCVNEEDYSLNEGNYVLTIDGYVDCGDGNYEKEYHAICSFEISKNNVATPITNLSFGYAAKKMLKNGLVVIERNGSKYLIMGQTIK